LCEHYKGSKPTHKLDVKLDDILETDKHLLESFVV